MQTHLLLIAIAAMMMSTASGAKILCMFGLSGKSHNNVFTALTTELARKGHELTVVTAYPIKNPPGIYKQIDAQHVREMMAKFDTFSNTNRNVFQKMKTVIELIGDVCPKILKMPEVQKLKETKFDLVFVSLFFNDCTLPFARYNDAPLILISPVGLVSWTSENIGNPEQLAYVPSTFLPYSDHMSFTERVMNTFMYVFLKLARSFVMLPKHSTAAEEFFDADVPTFADLESNASLVLINNHISINYPRPLLPNVIEVGAMHIKHSPEKLSGDIQEFIEGAKDGVIYFSMGSLVRLEQFPNETVTALINAFSELPQRVIWKWNQDTLPGQPKNVMIGKWLPQEAILAHPKVRLFITHGGLLSTQEALYHGMPLVGIPILGDQQLNVHRSQLLGLAEGVDIHSLTKHTLLEAITKVLQNPSYKSKAMEVMRRMRDQPETPLERAVFWTEYVLRHKGAPHLRSAATQLAWYQLYLLDVAAVVLMLVLAVIIALKTCCNMVCKSKGSSVASKTEKSKHKKKQ